MAKRDTTSISQYEYRRARYLKSLGRPIDYKKPRYKHNNRGNRLLMPDEYAELVQYQLGRCAICGSYKNGLNVDHCHTTGSVRGLLCSMCNSVHLPRIERKEIEGTKEHREYLSDPPALKLFDVRLVPGEERSVRLR